MHRAKTAWRTLAGALVGASALAGGGCGTTKMSSTARTATEQLLLTNAWDDALHRVDFRSLTGVPVYLDTQYVNAIDQGWIISSIRQAMLEQGVLLKAKPEQAQWICEARVGVYGTNDDNWLFGVPQVSVPPTLTGMPTGTIPEIPLAKRNRQQGVAKLALFAYDKASGHIAWTSGTMLATSTAKDVYIGGMGPFQSGTIRSGTEIMGMKLPSAADPGPSGPARPPRGDVPYHAPTMSLPSSAGDLESFRP